MWTISQDGDTWTLTRDGVVIETATGEEGYARLVAELSTRLAAEHELAVDVEPGDGLLPETWVSDMCFSEETGDGRDFRECTWSWRDPQAGFVPLMLQTETDFGHFGATLAGFISSIENPAQPRGGGRFYDSEAGRTFRDMLLGDRSFGVSVDPGAVDVEFECIETDDDGWCIDATLRFLAYEIIGLTGTPFPGFARASITLGAPPAGETAPVDDESSSDDDDDGGEDETDDEASMAAAHGSCCADCAAAAARRGGHDLSTRAASSTRRAPAVAARPRAIVAAAGLSIPVAPPRSWFDPDPVLLAALRDHQAGTIRALDNGRVYGYAAPDTCHISYPETCLTPADLTATNFGYFHIGYVECDDGTEVATGALTFAGRHAPLSMSLRAAMAHYEDTTLASADVRIGYDDHGLWIAGALRPEVTPEQLRTIRGSAPSYDARPIGTSLEVISVHYVNRPGHPMMARVASGRIMAVVASVSLPARDVELGSVDADVRALVDRERRRQQDRLRTARRDAARARLARR